MKIVTPRCSSTYARSLALLTGLCYSSLVLPASATTHTLISGGGDGSWNTGSNWTNDVPNLAGDTAAYSTAATAATTALDITGGGAVTIGVISKTASGNWTINTGTASGFVLDNTGGTGKAVIQNSSGSGALTVNPSIVFANTDLDVIASGTVTVGGAITASSSGLALTLKNNASNVMTLSGSLGTTGSSFALANTGTGTGFTIVSGNIGSNVSSITQNGNANGFLILSGNNSSYSGDVSITSGSLVLSSATALSASNLATLSGGTLDLGRTSNPSFSVTVAGLSGSTGNVTNSGQTAQTLTLGGSGTNSYAGTLGKSTSTANQNLRLKLAVALTGSGTQTLSGESFFTGGTTITSGTLLVNNTPTSSVISSGLGTGAVALNGGTLGGTGSIVGATTAASGSFLAPGTDGTAGTLTFASTLNISGLAGGAVGHLKFDLGAVGSSDKITLTTGALSIGTGLLNFDDFSFTTLSGFDNGVYTLLDTSTSITGTLGSSLSGVIAGHNAVLSTDGQDLFLTVTAGTIPEPSTYASLVGVVVLGSAALRRRRQAN